MSAAPPQHDAPLPFLGPRQPLANPEGGLSYPLAHRGPGFAPIRSWIGLALAFFGYALAVPLINQVLVWVFWLVSGRPGAFLDYFTRATRYEMPLGMVAGHLALGSLILISFLMTRGWQRRPSSFLVSVQPGMRWRYLVLCLPLAAVILNLMLWAGYAVGVAQGADWPRPDPASNWMWWLVVIVVFSPLQAAAEEFFFRGYLLQGVGSVFAQRWVGVVISALVFALFHGLQNVWLFIDRFGFGLMAGALVVVTGGLEAAIAAHVANNVFAFGYATFFGGVAATRAVQTIGPVDALLDLVGFALVGLVCWWLGRRMNVATTTPVARTRGRSSH